MAHFCCYKPNHRQWMDQITADATTKNICFLQHPRNSDDWIIFCLTYSFRVSAIRWNRFSNSLKPFQQFAEMHMSPHILYTKIYSQSFSNSLKPFQQFAETNFSNSLKLLCIKYIAFSDIKSTWIADAADTDSWMQIKENVQVNNCMSSIWRSGNDRA